MQKKIFAFLVSTIVLSACGTMQRSDHSGYGSLNNDFDSDFTRNNLEKDSILQDDTARELGYASSRSLSPDERTAVDDRMALKEAEKSLKSKREREQYYKYKAQLRSDRERIHFIEIGSIEGRQRWVETHGLNESEKYSSDVQEAVESEDIILGMTKQAVRESWGDPEIVEVAGNPIYGNERWKYTKHVATPDGYQTEVKMLYFEAGRVAGWEKF